MRIEQLGKALGIVCAAAAREQAMHADVDNFYAPSECHELVSKGEERRYRQARRHAEAIAKAPWRVIRSQARKRIGEAALRRAEGRCEEKAFARFCPY